jgi:hypothetical protein
MTDGNGSKPRTDYAVGYGRPPKHTQFKPGHSGNRKGRPGGARSLKTDFQEESNERIRITSGGKSKLITKQRATVKRLHAKALEGDMKAINTVLNMNMRLLGIDADGEQQDLSSEDAEILEFALARRKQRSEKPDGEGSS